MEELLLDILAHIRALPAGRGPVGLAPEELDRLVRRHNAGTGADGRRLSKRGILPFYLRVKAEEPDRWRAWGVDAALEERLLLTVRMKPRRTASGVATITVITRPHPCAGDCVYCPCDLRMPKSYLASEPACQRAERAWFDPYLQVSGRLRALTQMGHATDKVELIVLGGTWSDYPRAYQVWFVRELFRALNDGAAPQVSERVARERAERYRRLGIARDEEAARRFVEATQRRVDAGELTYNEAWERLYAVSAPHREAAAGMTATMDELRAAQERNVDAAHRAVGLVVETRPDAITPATLTFLRELGCTKIQMGVQSTRQEILDANGRGASVDQVRRAFALVRLFGFKIHVHLMANLVGATPEEDRADYLTLVRDPGFLPDEVKLYPCSLVGGTRLERVWRAGGWRPYTGDELLGLLVDDTLATPCYTRISRMVRDIGAQDIVVGNTHANLRQLVEERIARAGVAGQVQDVRYREIAGRPVDLATLNLRDHAYDTTVTREHFLEWVTPENRVAGFCRLSLPRWDELTGAGEAGGAGGRARGGTGALVSASDLPTRPGEAMIREVHVYGREARIGHGDSSSQHRGLGRALVERACAIAREAGFRRVHVISAVGTRAYYRRLGFQDDGLYQTRELA